MTVREKNSSGAREHCAGCAKIINAMGDSKPSPVHSRYIMLAANTQTRAKVLLDIKMPLKSSTE